MKTYIQIITVCVISIILSLFFLLTNKKQNELIFIENQNIKTFIIDATTISNSKTDVLTNENIIQINPIQQSTNLVDLIFENPKWDRDLTDWMNDVKTNNYDKILEILEHRIIKNPDEAEEYIGMVRHINAGRSQFEMKPTVYLYGKTILVVFRIIYPQPTEGYDRTGTSHFIYTIDSETKTLLSVLKW